MTVTLSSERIDTPNTSESARLEPSSTRRRVGRSVAGLAAAIAVAVAYVGVAAPATAAPGIPGVTAHQVASAPYSALFTMGVQVYERVQYIPEPGSRYRTMIMKRLYRPTDGKRGSARYAFLGDRLPSSFLVAEQPNSHGLPVGLAVPLLRGKSQTNWKAIATLTGRVGEIRSIGWVHRYLG
ncbi:hypothetical protein [Gordonia hydrophobica]|uniref:Uncharacterized protein n=1 Tax=Gordonia hydrophobica TaxID=40516 RepID=A0ABZ2TZ43_9ACTN|nr:hypothetical protein [Gordonia hydrophobica]MBM7369468.1 hypothetical protein [Gordonia hydrophobica]